MIIGLLRILRKVYQLRAMQDKVTLKRRQFEFMLWRLRNGGSGVNVTKKNDFHGFSEDSTIFYGL